jgi:hypothetical protein
MVRTRSATKSRKRLSRKYKKSTRKHKKITRRSRKSHQNNPLKRKQRQLKSHSLKRKQRQLKQRGGGSIDIMESANLYDVYGKKVNEVAVSHTMLGQDDPDF